jgi:hypothetical protein
MGRSPGVFSPEKIWSKWYQTGGNVGGLVVEEVMSATGSIGGLVGGDVGRVVGGDVGGLVGGDVGGLVDA